jgi:DNA-binding transcriptional regulator GbsR (MarR family)
MVFSVLEIPVLIRNNKISVREGRMNRDLEKMQHNFIERIGQLSSTLGFSKLTGQLYALLYLSEKPLSLDDMARKLAISKGSVSINIRELEEKGAAKKIWMKGSRKNFYEAEPDIVKIIKNRIVLSTSWRLTEMQNIIQRSEELIQNVPEGSGDSEQKIKFYRQRLRELKKFSKRTRSLLDRLLLFAKTIKL